VADLLDTVRAGGDTDVIPARYHHMVAVDCETEAQRPGGEGLEFEDCLRVVFGGQFSYPERAEELRGIDGMVGPRSAS
jgi:hypothetical protein